MIRSARASAALLLLLAACSPKNGAEGELGGTVIIGAAADADALLPPLAGTVQGRAASELLFDRLADMGPELNVNGDGGFEPRLARSWKWSKDSLVITFALDPDARWHDGQPVRAADVRLGYDITRDPANGSSLASHFGDVDSVSTPDSLTFSIHFSRRSAEQFYSATQVFPLPYHLLGAIPSGALRQSPAAAAPVGSGKFRFVSWEPKVRLELAAVPDHYRGRAGLDRVLFTMTPESATGLARIWAGESDVWEPLTPIDIREAVRHDHVRIYGGPGYEYGFLAFNFRDARDSSRAHPLFADREMRRALTMAVDRNALLQAVFDSAALYSFGPFTRPQNTSDTTITQIPFDRAAAIAKLETLGWRVGPDSVRRRGNQRLSFGVLVPSSSAVRNRVAVLLQEQLRQVGAEIRIESVEFAKMRDQWFAGRFDATIGGWRTTPSPSGIRGAWGSPAISRGARQNVGSYLNPVFDKAVEAGLGAVDPAERRAHMRVAYQTIVDDAAAIWLYEVRNAAAVHRRLNVPRWRSEAWWMTLPDWTVDPAQRLQRDARPAAP